LVSNPLNPRDELEQSVILIVTHTDQLGIGLQINNPQEDLDLGKISTGMGLPFYSKDPVYYGGNMNQNKIHVIHSLDWRSLSTVQLTKDIGITNDISILSAISQGEGPEFYKACSGYWLWEEGRLDIQLDPRNHLEHEPHKWEIAPANINNVFKIHPDELWERSIEASARYHTSTWL